MDSISACSRRVTFASPFIVRPVLGQSVGGDGDERRREQGCSTPALHDARRTDLSPDLPCPMTSVSFKISRARTWSPWKCRIKSRPMRANLHERAKVRVAAGPGLEI